MGNASDQLTYVTDAKEVSLPNSRQLVAASGSNLSVIDNGAGSTLQVATVGLLGSIAGQSANVFGIMCRTGNNTATMRSITSSTLTIVNAGGVAGNIDLEIDDNVSVQKVAVYDTGSLVGTRSSLNFIAGDGAGLTINDNSGSDRIDITVTAVGETGQAPIVENTSTHDLFVGTNAGNTGALTTATGAFAAGYGALASLTSGNNLVGIGYNALNQNATGSNSVAIGMGAAQNYTIDSITAIGTNSLNACTTGTGNAAAGYEACQNLNTNNNSGFGYQALQGATGAGNTGFGYQTLLNVSGSNNVGIGTSAGVSVTTGSNNIFIGSGADILTGFGTISNATAIGTNANVSASNTMVLGRGAAVVIGDTAGPTHVAALNLMPATGNANIYFGRSPSPTANTTGGTLWVDSTDVLWFTNNTSSYDLLTGGSAAPINATYWVSSANGTLTNQVNLGALSTGVLGITVSGSTATPSIVTKITDVNASGRLFIGTSAGNGTASGTSLVCIGRNAGQSLTTGTDSILIGDGAGAAITTASFCVAIGTSTLGGVTTSIERCTGVGYNVLVHNVNDSNNGFGYQALTTLSNGTNNDGFGSSVLNALATGSQNAAFGSVALGVLANGSGNTAMGAFAGDGVGINALDNCTFVGSMATAGTNSLSNSAAIGANSIVNANNTMVLGGNATQVVIGDNGTAGVGAGYSLNLMSAGGTASAFIGNSSSQTTPVGGGVIAFNNAAGGFYTTNPVGVAYLNGTIPTFKTGSNGTIGTSAAMSSGTVTVSTTSVKAGSIIMLTGNNNGVFANLGSVRIGTITPGTSFTIVSSNILDTSTVNWWIINPA